MRDVGSLRQGRHPQLHPLRRGRLLVELELLRALLLSQPQQLRVGLGQLLRRGLDPRRRRRVELSRPCLAVAHRGGRGREARDLVDLVDLVHEHLPRHRLRRSF